MLESGFVSKYHFILDVMNGNMSSTVLAHENKTIIWACGVLKREITFLQKKHPKLSNILEQLYWPYYENVRNLHDKVLDQIFENASEKYGNNKEETNNSN